MKFIVHSPSGEILKFDISTDMDLGSFIKLCALHTNILAQDLTLFNDGRQLQDNQRKIFNYNIIIIILFYYLIII